MGLSKGQKDMLTGWTIGTALNNANQTAQYKPDETALVNPAEAQNTVKSSQDIYNEAQGVAGTAANNAAQQIANQARAQAAQGGAGKLASAMAGAQAQVEAGQNIYNNQLNNAANLTQQQANLNTDIVQSAQQQNAQTNAAAQAQGAAQAAQNQANALDQYTNYMMNKKQAEKDRTNANKSAAMNLLGSTAGSLISGFGKTRGWW